MDYEIEKNRKRVLVFGVSGKGGIWTFIHNMGGYLKEYVFDYVVEGEEFPAEEVARADGSNVFLINQKKAFLKYQRDIKRILKNSKGKYESIYVNLSTLSSLASIKVALLYGYRVFVHAHLGGYACNGYLHSLVYKINKMRLSRMDVRRLSCSEKATEVMYCPHNRVELIWNAVDINRYSYESRTRDCVRKQFGDYKIIGFVGRLVEQKNPLFLSSILKRVLLYRTDVKMIVLGDGFLYEELLKQVSSEGLIDKCILLGQIDNVEEYYQAMDLLILPSLYEGLPFCVVEALASGLKCIVSDRVTKELNVNGNISYLSVDNNDADLWAKEICKELDKNSCDRQELSESFRESKFNISREANHFRKILSGH